MCTHLGCTVRAEALSQPETATVEGRATRLTHRFLCPCHGSRYTGDGANVAGPAPRPLAWFHLSIAADDGQLVVDLADEVGHDFRLTMRVRTPMKPSAQPKSVPPSAPGVHPTPLWSVRPASDREAGDAVVSNFLLHWFPAKVFKASLDWTYSFWLGTVSAALLLLLMLSGLPLLFLYVPSVERAYQSVKDIEYVITFGSWIRAVHRISAHLMVIAVVLHLVRVFLTGAYKNGIGPGPAPRVELGDRRRRCCC